MAQDHEWRPLPNAPVAFRHEDVHFLSSSLGWVSNNQGEIHKTTDGGDSWVQQLQIDPNIRSIHFVNESIGLAGTIEGGELLYRTTDGGDNWISIDASVPEPKPEGLCGIAGFDNYVFACGEWLTSARFIRSSDSGATWTSVDLSSYARNVIDVHFFSPDSGFVVGGSPRPEIQVPIILFTKDGGQSWTRRYTGPGNGDYAWKIFFVNRMIGYVSLQISQPNTGVVKTTDGGVTWELKHVPLASNLQGVGFATETLGWCHGFGGPVMQTTDGGETWEPYVIVGEPEPELNRFQMLSETLGYAAGRTIYKYVPATTAIQLAEVPLGAKFSLANHPNPFNPRTTISYMLPKNGRVKVRVYAVLGNRVRTLVDGYKSAGNRWVVWEGRDDAGRELESGIYFYRVDADGRADSNRMILLN